MTIRELVTRWSRAEKHARRRTRKAQGNVLVLFALAREDLTQGNTEDAELLTMQAERLAERK